MHVRVIQNEDDLTNALRAIDRLWNAPPGSDDGDKLDALVALVTAYEDRHYKVPPSNPIDVLKHVMDERGLTQNDLGLLLGSRPRASEILSGKRPLTLEQIRLVAHTWHIPAGALVGVYEPA